MASDIQPGAYVRAIGGMYAGATGRVVRIGVSASGPYATVDVGEAQPVAVFVTGLELVGAAPTAEQERDAAVAERDRLRAEVADLLPEADAKQHFATRALRAEERLQRLRRDVEALYAAVCERARQLDPDVVDGGDAADFAHAELSEFAARVRVILAGER